MNTNTHTPGPWLAHGNSVTNSEGRSVAVVRGRGVRQP